MKKIKFVGLAFVMIVASLSINCAQQAVTKRKNVKLQEALQEENKQKVASLIQAEKELKKTKENSMEISLQTFSLQGLEYLKSFIKDECESGKKDLAKGYISSNPHSAIEKDFYSLTPQMPSDKSTRALVEAVRDNKNDQIEKIIKEMKALGIDFSQIILEPNKDTILHYAVACTNLEAVSVLLQLDCKNIMRFINNKFLHSPAKLAHAMSGGGQKREFKIRVFGEIADLISFYPLNYSDEDKNKAYSKAADLLKSGNLMDAHEEVLRVNGDVTAIVSSHGLTLKQIAENVNKMNPQMRLAASGYWEKFTQVPSTATV